MTLRYSKRVLQEMIEELPLGMRSRKKMLRSQMPHQIRPLVKRRAHSMRRKKKKRKLKMCPSLLPKILKLSSSQPIMELIIMIMVLKRLKRSSNLLLRMTTSLRTKMHQMAGARPTCISLTLQLDRHHYSHSQILS